MFQRTIMRKILNYTENTFLHDMTRYIDQKSNIIPPFGNWNHKTTNISNYKFHIKNKLTSSYEAYEFVEKMIENEKNMK